MAETKRKTHAERAASSQKKGKQTSEEKVNKKKSKDQNVTPEVGEQESKPVPKRLISSIVFLCLFGASSLRPSAVGNSRFTLILSTKNPVKRINSGSAPGIAFTCI